MCEPILVDPPEVFMVIGKEGAGIWAEGVLLGNMDAKVVEQSHLPGSIGLISGPGSERVSSAGHRDPGIPATDRFVSGVEGSGDDKEDTARCYPA